MFLVIASGPADDIPLAGFHYETDARDRADQILAAGPMAIANYVADYFHAIDRPPQWPGGVLVLEVSPGGNGIGKYRRVLCEPFDKQPDPNAAKLAAAMTANYCPECGAFTRGGSCCEE